MIFALFKFVLWMFLLIPLLFWVLGLVLPVTQSNQSPKS